MLMIHKVVPTKNAEAYDGRLWLGVESVATTMVPIDGDKLKLPCNGYCSK